MAKKRVAVLLSGRGTNFAALLFASRAAGCPYEIVMVISDVADAAGLNIARAEDVAVFTPTADDKALFEAEVNRLLVHAQIDVIALAGFMRILSGGFVERWEGKILNIHPSLLPKYKGLRTHARAMIDGESHTGASVHLVTAKLDDGPVLGQTPVAIIPGEDVVALADRVLVAEHELYPRVLAAFCAP
ncbi:MULTISPECIES: phosphoribosylglycinamide formyltransferase [unclassified Sphingomonas]|uniref:phosphoribosylglycinamide formyltransferase n=1 Tax=unclassified Sphingomonas TaxID=196159 RepID=UPI000BDD9FFC|nr:MAG: phosphoribosylglycinamide formyltransferase [Sphingomonas sp. 12-62-6]OYX37348.1 MAG: phosphoribosylglycinamide formyltransferase [Sphingomonas sp. 32-62-10]